MDFVHLARMRSFTPTAHLWGCTGVLAAAAAVPVTTMDGNAGAHLGQRASCEDVYGRVAQTEAVEAIGVDKENIRRYAALCKFEDAMPQVLIAS